MSAVGRGEMRAADAVRAMYPDYKEERAAAIAQQPKPESGWFGLKRAKSVKVIVPGEPGAAIPIRGINSDLPVRFAPNGGAVPGDRIVGILTPGEGITIYPIQSPALKDFEDAPERWLDLRWDVEERTPQRFPARIVLQTVNEPGSLAQVAQIIAETCDIPRDTITPDSHAIDDLGIDSLDFLDIAFAIDKAFGIKLPLEKWTQEVNDGKATTEQYFVLKNLCDKIDELIAAKGA